MKKQMTAFLLAVVLCILCAIPTSAQPKPGYVFDTAGVLLEEEVLALNQQAEDVYQAYGIGVYFVMMDDALETDIASYAQQVYEEIAYSDDGVLLAITDAGWQVHLSGQAEEYFTDADKEALQNAFDKADTWSGGVSDYISEAEQILSWQGISSPLPEADDISQPSPEESRSSRLVDDAGLLSENERSVLLARLDEISERQQFDIAIVTTNTLGGKSPMEYADDFYDYHGYGMGENRDGVLLLVSMESRDWWVSTTGYGITAITDAGREYMSEQFLPDLSDGNYAAAFDTFASLCDEFVTQSKTEQPYDTSSLPKEPFSLLWIPGALLIGLVLGLIVTGVMRSQLKSVRSQAAASDYVKAGSMHVTQQQDLFLYRTVNRTERPKDHDSGGSATHTSSSGETHGGGGGSF